MIPELSPLSSPGGLVPALPSSILEPLWVQYAALLPARRVHHPLGCHRPRIPDRLVFDKLIQILVFGCGYRRIADATCSATTLRRRRDEWITLGLPERLRLAVLGAYDRLFGLELEHLAVDGCITKAPCGGGGRRAEPGGPSQSGLKRSVATDAGGIALAAVPAPANRRDDGLLAATLDAVAPVRPLPQRPVVHLDAGYDFQPCRQVLAQRGMAGEIATLGKPAPVQPGGRLLAGGAHPRVGQPVRLLPATRHEDPTTLWTSTRRAAATSDSPTGRGHVDAGVAGAVAPKIGRAGRAQGGSVTS